MSVEGNYSLRLHPHPKLHPLPFVPLLLLLPVALWQFPLSKFWAVGKLSENLSVEKLYSKSTKFGLSKFHFREI